MLDTFLASVARIGVTLDAFDHAGVVERALLDIQTLDTLPLEQDKVLQARDASLAIGLAKKAPGSIEVLGTHPRRGVVLVLYIDGDVGAGILDIGSVQAVMSEISGGGKQKSSGDQKQEEKENTRTLSSKGRDCCECNRLGGIRQGCCWRGRFERLMKTRGQKRERGEKTNMYSAVVLPR